MEIYQYVEGKLSKLDKIPMHYSRFNWQLHHYVKQQQVKRNPNLEKYQKLIFMPTQMHIDLHNCISNFQEKWGLSRKELLYGTKYD